MSDNTPEVVSGRAPRPVGLYPHARRAGNLLFVLKDDAELMVARPTPGGFEPIKTYTVADSATWPAPSFSGNRIFVKDQTSLTLWAVP